MGSLVMPCSIRSSIVVNGKVYSSLPAVLFEKPNMYLWEKVVLEPQLALIAATKEELWIFNDQSVDDRRE
jgi:hypothetical protein